MPFHFSPLYALSTAFMWPQSYSTAWILSCIACGIFWSPVMYTFCLLSARCDFVSLLSQYSNCCIILTSR